MSAASQKVVAVRSLAAQGHASVCSQRGVILVAVLWIVMALSIIVTGLSRSVRDEAKMLSMARQGAQASALGDAAIQLVLQQMAVDAKPVDRVTTVQVPYQGRQMDVQVMPLNGLVDLNSAKTPLLARLLTVAGGLPESAAEPLAQAIVDYREQRTAQGASRRFEASEDLMRVPGVNYDLYARLAPLLSTAARGASGVNPRAAPLPVLLVLTLGNQAQAQALYQQRLQPAGPNVSAAPSMDTSSLPPDIVSQALGTRYRLQARSLGFNAYARLYNATGKVVAEERLVNCLP